MTHSRQRLRRFNRFTVSLKVMAISSVLIRSFYFACFTTGLFTFLFLFMFVERPKQVIHIDMQQQSPPSSPLIIKSKNIRDKFAIYSCTTPSTTAAINDYAYYLPLTALAWERLGFKSLVFIIGTREKWTAHSILSYILSCLEEVKDVHIFFIQSPHNHEAMISQNIRLFASYLPQLSGLDENDYLITTDTDLWPLKRSIVHMPDNYELLLAHSHCCSDFEHLNGRFYRMLPISYIGARLSTWRQIMKCSDLSFDDPSKTILNILQSEFGSSVMKITSAVVNKYSDEWVFDQYLASIRIDEWMKDYQNEQTVVEVSEKTFKRVDTKNWEYFPDFRDPQRHYDSLDDIHRIPLVNATFPWVSFRFLLKQMYGYGSRQMKWATRYTSKYLKMMTK